MDPEKERIALGIKQLSSDPFEGAMEGITKGSIVTCTVSEITSGGIEVDSERQCHWLYQGNQTSLVNAQNSAQIVSPLVKRLMRK